jgi:HEAT repeat protein
LPALEKALKDEERKVRIGAARALGQIGDEAALRALDEAVGEKPADEAADADLTVEHEYLTRLSVEQHAIAKFKASRLRHNTGPLTTGKLAEWAAQQRLPQLDVVIAVTATRPDTRDGDIAGLASLEALTRADLACTLVTDAGLIHLKGLKNLKYVDLHNTKVTDAGVVALQKALPELKINREPRSE